VPACIEPLGPSVQLPAFPRKPTWAEFMASLEPIRHLREGERLDDWMSDNPLEDADADADEQAPPSRQVGSAPSHEPSAEESRAQS